MMASSEVFGFDVFGICQVRRLLSMVLPVAYGPMSMIMGSGASSRPG